MLVASPVLVALIGLVVERFLFRRFYREDPALGLLLTFGLAMVAEQSLRVIFGAAPLPFSIPHGAARARYWSATSSTRSTGW